MTPLQKVIKYGAIAFGFYLVFVILSAIIIGIVSIFSIFIGIDTYKTFQNKEKETVTSFEEIYKNVDNLDIKIDVSKLTIKTADELKVEVINPTSEFYCEKEGNTLEISDKRKKINLLNLTDEIMPEIIIYVPNNKKFEKVEIATGVSATDIEKIEANKIEIEIGVGKFTIKEINADTLKINGGTGEATIEQSNLKDLRLNAGVGKFVINSEIEGQAEIEAGVGQLIINLEGNKNDYKVKTSTGLGTLLVDNQKVVDDQVIGEGDRNIKVEAGVGEVKVNFTENNI